MKYLLIGGGGFIGAWLTDALVKMGEECVVYDPVGKKSNNPRIRSIHRRFDHSLEFLDPRIRFDVVINLAATPIEKKFEDETSLKQLTNDVEICYHAINFSKNQNAKFIYMSSVFAYGDHEYCITENHPLNPKTPYGISKATCEHMVRSQLHNWNIIRTTSVYGWGDTNQRATNIFINKALKKESFLVNDGVWLDFIYIKDIVKGIIKVAREANPGEVFHISGGRALTLKNFAEELKPYFKNLSYKVKKITDRPKRGTLSNDKARMLLGWSPQYNLKSGVKDYMRYVIKHGSA